MLLVFLGESFYINIQTESFALYNFNGSLVPIIGLGIRIKLGKPTFLVLNNTDVDKLFLERAKSVQTWMKKFLALALAISGNCKNVMLERSHTVPSTRYHSKDNSKEI